MTPPIVRLLGTAILLDVFLVWVTPPMTKFLMMILVPRGVMTTPQAQWPFAFVVFMALLGVVLYLLWFFENWYAHLFSFWKLCITMFIVFWAILYLNNRF